MSLLSFVFKKQVLESWLHVALDKMCFFLYFFHLILDLLDSLLDNLRVQERLHLSWWITSSNKRIWTIGYLACNWSLLHRNDLLEFINLAAHIWWTSLCILIQQFHFIELALDRRQHLKHHPSILVEYILLQICRAINPSSTSIHKIINDLTYLFLIVLKDFNLPIHHLSLAQDKTLGYSVSILLL